MSPPSTLSKEHLKQVAFYQKGVIACVAIYILLVVLQFVFPQEHRIILALPGLVVVITGAVFVFLLSAKVYPPALGIALAILTLIPCIGLIVLLVINGKATGILQKHGITVGLLGANLNQIKDATPPIAPIGDKEYGRVIALSAKERYDYLVVSFVKEGALWTLTGPQGLVTTDGPDGRVLVPVWPHPRFAAACAWKRWKGARPSRVSLPSWEEKWTPGLKQDGRHLLVFPTADDEGLAASPEKFDQDQQMEDERLPPETGVQSAEPRTT